MSHFSPVNKWDMAPFLTGWEVRYGSISYRLRGEIWLHFLPVGRWDMEPFLACFEDRNGHLSPIIHLSPVFRVNIAISYQFHKVCLKNKFSLPLKKSRLEWTTFYTIFRHETNFFHTPIKSSSKTAYAKSSFVHVV